MLSKSPKIPDTDDLKALLSLFKDHPHNAHLINRIAIAHYENFSSENKGEDLRHFELAYRLKPTVKTAHNLAWFLYFETDDRERAFEIQQQCIDFKPSSAMPFNLMGYMLLDLKNYEAALPNFQVAARRSTQHDILHNMALCHLHLDQVIYAYKLFAKASGINDGERRSLYNLALAAIATGKIDKARAIAGQVTTHIDENIHTSISGYEIGQLYFLMGEYEMTVRWVEAQGVDGINLEEWRSLSYAYHKTDVRKWKELLTARKNTLVALLKDFKHHDPDYQDFTEVEKLEQHNSLTTRLKAVNDLLTNGPTKPEINYKELAWEEYCGCLLFDCPRHGNPFDDDDISFRNT